MCSEMLFKDPLFPASRHRQMFFISALKRAFLGKIVMTLKHITILTPCDSDKPTAPLVNLTAIIDLADRAMMQ